MTSITRKNLASSDPTEVDSVFVATRIDAAHVATEEALAVRQPAIQEPLRLSGDDLGTDLDELARLANPSAPQKQDQLRLQASQLAEFLRNKQAEIDQREAALNASTSELDKERRAFRLQTREWEDWKAQAEAEHLSRSQQLEHRLADLSTTELEVSHGQDEVEQRLAERLRETADRQREYKARSEELSQRITEFDRLRQEFEHERIESQERLALAREQLASERRIQEDQFTELLTQLDQNRRAWESQKQQRSDDVDAGQYQEIEQTKSELQAARQKLQTKAAQLETLESLLQEGWTACERERRELELERAKADGWLREQQTDLAEQRLQLEKSSQLRAVQFQQREDSVARRISAVEQTRQDLMRLHQETLEMRLVLEQLWNQLGERLGGSELTRSIAAARNQLADEYRLANRTLAEQQGEIKEFARRLTDHQSRLRRQRSELHEWLARRNQDLLERETRLDLREEQLAQPERQILALQKQLENQRHLGARRLHELATQIGVKLRTELRGV